MLRNYEKFIFLGVIIVLAFFARATYPGTAPSGPGTKSGPGQSQTAIMVLPQIGVAAASDPPALKSTGDPAQPQSQKQELQAIASQNDTVGSLASSSFFKTGNAPAPVISGVAELVADPRTGSIFQAVNSWKRWPTASITKLMTASVALDTVDPTAKITITPGMLAADPTEPTVKAGDTYSVNDLMHLMLMPSSNVAAEALAGSRDRTAFMNAMNARAQAWGMKDTYFDDPSGISAANQSTAADMLTLAEHIFDGYPSVFAITRTPQAVITELASGKKTAIKSINTFAGQPDFIGGKTGHTDEAGGNLLSVFRYDGHPLTIVVLGTDDRFNETQKLYSWFKQNYQ